jgi:Protein of unknown function (DUF3644)
MPVNRLQLSGRCYRAGICQPGVPFTRKSVMTLSADLGQKSIQAAITAIEIYNKPNFPFREEAFAMLMTNAWELLLKAKWVFDHGEAIESLYEIASAGTPKFNRSGNPLTHSVGYLATKFLEDQNSGLELGCHGNILALIEIRDNAAHFMNKDLYFGRRVLEIGTASLRNYLLLAQEWLQLDLSNYNFFLMPISFYHGFEAAVPASRARAHEASDLTMPALNSSRSRCSNLRCMPS